MAESDPQHQTQAGQVPWIHLHTHHRNAAQRQNQHAQLRQEHLEQWQRDENLGKLRGIALPRSKAAPSPSQVREQAAAKIIAQFDAAYRTS
ncbi:hypothetical protein RB597_000014 [Gaeumannomyces tritici]